METLADAIVLAALVLLVWLAWPRKEKRAGAPAKGDEPFECSACGEPFGHTGVCECRICLRAHCSGCINAEGLCVPCSNRTSP